MLRRRAAIALLLLSLMLSSFVPSGVNVSARGAATPTAPVQQAAGVATSTRQAPDVIERIKDEGMNRSQVMKTIGYLTDVIGPRLTNSPHMKRANMWTRDKLTEWGLQNAHLEAWGPFGRGWTLQRFSAEVIEPQGFPLVAYPKAWSPGTNGPLVGEVVYVDADSEADLQKYKGKLKGAIVLVGSLREVRAGFEPRASRLSEKQLLELADAPDPALAPPRRRRELTTEQRAAQQFAARKNLFYMEEGAALLVDSSRGGDGGMLQFVQSASVPHPPDTPSDRITGPWDKSAPRLIPQIGISNDHYNRMMRMLQQGEKIRLAVNLAVQFHDDDLMGYNTIAEIPGSDLRDEVVMLGAHMDSWHLGTGATDNAAGVGVMMEAVRILQALKLQPRRTIRIALWSGEEQGLLGSRAYVAQHFGAIGDGSEGDLMAALTGARPAKITTKPEYDKFNVYFNLDNGTGKIRGIYMQGNEAVRPLFRQWLGPFREMGASTLTVSNSGGSDFLAFDGIGLPGFSFIQDEIEYDARTWHSNQDVFDRILADDVKQAAVVTAALAYNAATSDQKLPRKPVPSAR